MSKKYKLLKDLPDTDAGTFLHHQDGMYYYKTRTEEDRWFKETLVENNPLWFKRMEEKIYTQSDIDEARLRAFNAARKLEHGGLITGYLGKGLVYNTVDDYLITINDNKK